MRVLNNVMATSTFVLIILLLCSFVFGALISYLLVMSNYYNMPENTTLLIVENVAFPVLDARYFNVTILNPSNSASDANITAIRLIVEGKNEIHNIVATEPELGILRRGTTQTFRCLKNWSNFTGETVRIEPIAEDASTKSHLYTTPKAKLLLTPNFDASESVEYFNLSIVNSADSAVNLTISEIRFLGLPINATPSLEDGYVLAPSEKETFQCNYNWENFGGENVEITIVTAEGYEIVQIAEKIPDANVYIDNVRFNYSDTTYFNLTISSTEDSTTVVTISGINMTLADKASVEINDTRRYGPFKDLLPALRSVPPNGSTTFECVWNWTQYRDENFTVNAYTEEGFTVLPKLAKTPPAILWNITGVNFDLDEIGHFSVNVTNMPISLQDINITMIEFNQMPTNMNSLIIATGEQATVNCEYNWSDSVGKHAEITVYTKSEMKISYNLTLPYLKIDTVTFSAFSIGNPYINITIHNSRFSATDANITQIFIKNENKTYSIDGTITEPQVSPNGYTISVNANTTIVCPWNWNPHLSQNITVTVQTAEGVYVSKTVQVVSFTP